MSMSSHALAMAIERPSSNWAVALVGSTMPVFASEPNPKRVEQFQQVVIQFGCETERRSRCPGPKLPDASMGDADVAIQVI